MIAKTLIEKSPNISDEFDNNNNSFTVYDRVNSKTKIQFICKYCGHSYSATLDAWKKKGNCCPNCTRKFQTSFPQQLISFYLGKTLDVNDRFKVGGCEADIYIPDKQLAIEYNEPYWHSKKSERDKKKKEVFVKNGIRIITVVPSIRNFYDQESDTIFFNHINNTKENFIKYSEMQFVVDILVKVLDIQPIIIDIVNDEPFIYETFKRYIRNYNLQIVRPDVANLWHPTKNGNLKPNMVLPKDTIKCWFKCRNGHSFQSAIYNMTRNPIGSVNGCPYCSNRKLLMNFNDLTACDNEIWKHWDYEKNSVYPEAVIKTSKKEYFFKCDCCGNSYKQKAFIWVQSTHMCKDCVCKNRLGVSQKQKVKQFSCDGKLLNVFDSISEAKRISGATHILNLRESGGYIWVYSGNMFSQVDERVIESAKRKQNEMRDIQTLANYFNKNNRATIIEYAAIKKISYSTARCIYRKCKESGLLVFECSAKERRIARTKMTHSKKVVQMDLQGNFIREFESMTIAANSINTTAKGSKIGLVCQGKRNTAYGYKWSYAND